MVDGVGVVREPGDLQRLGGGDVTTDVTTTRDDEQAMIAMLGRLVELPPVYLSEQSDDEAAADPDDVEVDEPGGDAPPVKAEFHANHDQSTHGNWATGAWKDERSREVLIQNPLGNTVGMILSSDDVKDAVHDDDVRGQVKFHGPIAVAESMNALERRMVVEGLGEFGDPNSRYFRDAAEYARELGMELGRYENIPLAYVLQAGHVGAYVSMLEQTDDIFGYDQARLKAASIIDEMHAAMESAAVLDNAAYAAAVAEAFADFTYEMEHQFGVSPAAGFIGALNTSWTESSQSHLSQAHQMAIANLRGYTHSREGIPESMDWLADHPEWPQGLRDSKQLYSDWQSAFDAAAAATYRHTQQVLAGVESVGVYRGVRGINAVNTSTGDFAAEINPLSSWSTDPITAWDFAGSQGYVFEVTVPTDHIYSTAAVSGLGSLPEYEVILTADDMLPVRVVNRDANGNVVGTYDDMYKLMAALALTRTQDGLVVVRVDEIDADWLRHSRTRGFSTTRVEFHGGGSHDDSTHGNWASLEAWEGDLSMEITDSAARLVGAPGWSGISDAYANEARELMQAATSGPQFERLYSGHVAPHLDLAVGDSFDIPLMATSTQESMGRGFAAGHGSQHDRPTLYVMRDTPGAKINNQEVVVSGSFVVDEITSEDALTVISLTYSAPLDIPQDLSVERVEFHGGGSHDDSTHGNWASGGGFPGSAGAETERVAALARRGVDPGDFDGPVLHRGIAITVSDELKRRIDTEIYAGADPDNPDEFNAHLGLGPIIAEQLLGFEGHQGVDRTGGLGQSWTTRESVSESVSAGHGSNLVVKVTGRIRQSDVLIQEVDTPDGRTTFVDADGNPVEDKTAYSHSLVGGEMETRIHGQSPVDIIDVQISTGNGKWASVWGTERGFGAGADELYRAFPHLLDDDFATRVEFHANHNQKSHGNWAGTSDPGIRDDGVPFEHDSVTSLADQYTDADATRQARQFKHDGAKMVASFIGAEDRQEIADELNRETLGEMDEILRAVMVPGIENDLQAFGIKDFALPLGVAMQVSSLSKAWQLMEPNYEMAEAFQAAADAYNKTGDAAELSRVIDDMFDISVAHGAVDWRNSQWQSSAVTPGMVAFHLAAADTHKLYDARRALNGYYPSGAMERAEQIGKYIPTTINRVLSADRYAIEDTLNMTVRRDSRDTVTVYRGVKDTGHAGTDYSHDGITVTQGNPLTSWTVDRDTAKGFAGQFSTNGGFILTAEVPVDQIVGMSTVSGWGSVKEREVILLGEPIELTDIEEINRG
jgi:hypothetical protein